MHGHLRLRPIFAVALVFTAMLTADAKAELTHGMYENCAPENAESECLTRLGEMRSAGITRVINYWVWQGSDEERLAYADEATRLGIQLLYPIRPDWDPDELREAVLSVRDHPATWGYYVGEELDPSHATSLAERSALIEAVDPVHPRMYVAWGPSRLGQTLAPFREAADVLATDYYPVGADLPLSDTEKIAKRTGEIAAGGRMAMVLQAFNWMQEPTLAPPWATDRFPTWRQMRAQRDYARRGGARLLFWFDYYFLRPPGSSDYSHLYDLAHAIAAKRDPRVAAR